LCIVPLPLTFELRLQLYLDVVKAAKPDVQIGKVQSGWTWNLR
jgi:hypothetical protein